jgi:hypothetical protein
VEPIQLAAFLAAVVLVASMASVELGVTVALIELTLGVVAGNVFDLQSQQWLDFIAAFASIALTFIRHRPLHRARALGRSSSSRTSGSPSFSPSRSRSSWGCRESRPGSSAATATA